MTAHVDGVVPRRVVHAGSTDEVRDAVRAGDPIVASGLGAHLDVGAAPRALGTLLHVDRMRRVLDHPAADMTVTVEAGCPLSALAAELAGAGQWLPLDPPRFAETTVGGLIAANLWGPLRASQGTVRDLLLGLAVVGADGTVVRGGGRVVKNVAGYDLPKLHVGALGTLGVVVEATFKLRPRPEREAAVVLPTTDVADAVGLALAVRAALDPLWLEAGALPGGVGVAVGLGGTRVEVDAARRRVAAVARGADVELADHEDGAAVRASLADFPARPAAAVLRASVLPTDLPAIVDAARRALGDAVPILAHAASGVAHVAVTREEDVVAAVGALRSVASERRGFVVVERATPAVKDRVDVWGEVGETLGLMRKLKAAFDPRGVFAPGRFVGRL